MCRNRACNFIKKETLAQVFSCEFCETFKNAFFCKTPLVAAFVLWTTIKLNWTSNISELTYFWFADFKLFYIFFETWIFVHLCNMLDPTSDVRLTKLLNRTQCEFMWYNETAMFYFWIKITNWSWRKWNVDLARPMEIVYFHFDEDYAWLYLLSFVGYFPLAYTKVYSILSHWSNSIPPENIRKPTVFWYFQGV